MAKPEQPEECKPKWMRESAHPKGGYWTPQCKNLKEDGGGMEGERYECEVCGYSYFLDYEEMR